MGNGEGLGVNLQREEKRPQITQENDKTNTRKDATCSGSTSY